MRIALVFAVLAASNTAWANDGYVKDSAGNVVRGGDGECWHTINWTPEKAIPGCDGKSETPPAPKVDESGCLKKLDQEVTISIDVNFATDSAEIEGDASAEIEKVVYFMKKYPNVNVTIEGYTDNQGGTQKNKKLSQKRADSVKAALVSGGIFALRLTSVGYGSQNPIADNKTPEGRSKNRRVVAHAKAEVEAVEPKE